MRRLKEPTYLVYASYPYLHPDEGEKTGAVSMLIDKFAEHPSRAEQVDDFVSMYGEGAQVDKMRILPVGELRAREKQHRLTESANFVTSLRVRLINEDRIKGSK